MASQPPPVTKLELDDDINIEVNESELEMQTFCSGGPGGQHQNKTQSGVRLIHKSGVRAESRRLFPSVSSDSLV